MLGTDKGGTWGRRLRALLGLALLSCRGPDAPGPPLDGATLLPGFDPAALVEGLPPRVGEASPLAVLDLRPEGPEAAGAIRLRLNQALVDPEAPGVDARLRLRVAADEAGAGPWREVAGSSRWASPDSLVFEPDHPLDLASRYEVALEGELRGRGGGVVAGTRWSFETPRPTVTLDEHLYEPVAPDAPVFVAVTPPVDPATLAAHLRASTSTKKARPGRELDLRVREATEAEREALADDATWYAIAARRGWPAGATVELRVDAALRTPAGPLPLARPFTASFPVRDRLRALGIVCERPGDSACEPGSIIVKLSTEISDEEAQRIVVRPRPDDLSVYASAAGDDWAVDLWAPFELDKTYTVTLPAGLRDVHGQRLGRPVRERLRFTEASTPQFDAASIALSDREGIFLRPEDARVGVYSHHVEEVALRAVPLDDAALARSVARTAWPAAPPRSAAVPFAIAPTGPDHRSRRPLDLGRYVGQGGGVLVDLEATRLTAIGRSGEPPTPARGVFQISSVGAVLHVGPARGVVEVLDAVSGAPRPGVEATLYTPPGQARALGVADDRGLIRLPAADALGDDAVILLRDKASGERLALPVPVYPWALSRGSSYYRYFFYRYQGGRARLEPDERPEGLRQGERAVLAIRAGRGLYVPGDTIRVAGWAAVATPFHETSTRPVPPRTTAKLELRRDDEVVLQREVDVSAHGRFAAELPLPPTLPPDRYRVVASALGGEAQTYMTVAHVRIPSFELEATATPDAVVRGESVELRARARYLSGEPAPIESLHHYTRCARTSQRWDRFDDRWSFMADVEVEPWRRSATIEPPARASTVTAELATDALPSGAPLLCTVSAAAIDAALQEVGADASFLVHPAPIYLGVRRPEGAVAGAVIELPVQAIDVDGERVAVADAQVTIWREADDDSRVEVKSCALDIPAAGPPPTCRTRLKPGRYAARVTARAGDDRLRADGRFSVDAPPRSAADAPRSRSRRAATTTEAAPPPERPFAVVVPEHLDAGGPGWVEIEAPWDHARGTLEVVHTGLRELLDFTIEGGRARVRVRPGRGRGPVMALVATVARPAEDGGLPTLHRARARVDVRERTDLDVAITMPARARPGEAVPVRLAVRDSDGAPAPARLAVWAVDDGVHQLRPPHDPHLSGIFNPLLHDEAFGGDSYAHLLEPWSPHRFGRRTKRTPKVRSAAAKVTGSETIRERFDAAPLFVGDLAVDGDGEAELTLQLPDDLTRFRLTAIASAPRTNRRARSSAPARFGAAEATVEVAAPLMVRAITPRVVRPGDRAELAALVTLPAGQRGILRVDASVRGAGASLVGETHYQRRVDAPGPHRIPFAITTERAGEAEVTLEATLLAEDGEALAAAVRRPLPVVVERTQIERAAIYGSFDADAPVAIPVRVPDDLRRDHGGLSLTIRGSALDDLEDAATYLVKYPYGCLEQTASRLLPIVALHQLSGRLAPSVADPRAFADAHVARILSMQRPDGDFTLWPEGQEVDRYAGAYAIWVLGLAREAGVAVPEAPLAKAHAALHAHLGAPLPTAPWGRRTALIERAFAAHALASAGEPPGGTLAHLFDSRAELPPFARAVLLMAVHAADPRDPRVTTLRGQLSAAIEARAGAAHVLVDEALGDALYDSQVRTDAIALVALLQVAPDDPRIEPLARGLTRSRVGGRWRNTQENAWALLGLARYAAARERDAPDHRLAAWIGAQQVLDVERRAPAAPPEHVRVAMPDLLRPLAPRGSDRTTHVVLDRDGPGRVYYRVGMEWATTGEAPARSQGLGLRWALRDADGPVAPDALVAGRRYALDVTLEVATPTRHVAVDLPLPGGLEAIDPALGAGILARTLWTYPPFEVIHQELHPDRALLFFDHLRPGVVHHSVIVLATAPGRYVLPPAAAEAMYTPELYARTRGASVTIAPRP